MDAHAHLLSLGWAGPGHALDSKPYKQKGHRGLAYDPSQTTSNTGNGLVKPLLVSQRKGRLGIGKKTHEPQAGNEWWLKGFESALGNIGKSESERSSGASTPVPYSNLNGRKHSGLYNFFIKGQEMAGTIGENGEIIDGPGRKRKSNLLDGADDDDDDAQHTSGSNSKRLKSTSAAEFKLVSEYIALRDKDERRPRRTERPSPVVEFQQVGEYIQARSEKDKKKRKRQSEEEEESETANTPLTLTADDDGPVLPETKEERRERRRRRREQKANSRAEESKNGVPARQLIDEGGEGEGDQDHDQAQAAKAARKAERRKRKAEQAAKSAD